MKLRNLLYVLALAAPLGLDATPARAAYLFGTLGFDADVTTADTGDVTTATQFTFTTTGPGGGANTQDTTGPATGSFAGVAPGTVVTSTVLDLVSSPYLTLTLGGNSFTATFLVSDGSAAANARTIDLTGTIVGVGFDPTPARFLLQFNQAGGAGTTISYSGTLTASPVPEPSSMVLAALGGVAMLGLRWRRRLRRD
jgi:hypothetical protein